jgi:hypothetical protein
VARRLLDIPRWLQSRAARRVEVLAQARRGERRRRAGAPPSASDRARLAQLIFEGGVVFRVPTGGLTPTGEERGVSLAVQPDGDMLLSLPHDFGDQPGDEAAGARLLADARQGLAAMWRALPGSWVGVAYVAVEAAATAGPISWTGFRLVEGWTSFTSLSWLGLAQHALSVAGPLAICAVPFALGALRPYIAARVLRRLKEHLAQP